MKQITWKALKILGNKKLLEITPCLISTSVNHGEIKPTLVMGKIDEIVVVSDLPPLMRQRILLTEQMARAGMPKPEEVS